MPQEDNRHPYGTPPTDNTPGGQPAGYGIPEYQPSGYGYGAAGYGPVKYGRKSGTDTPVDRYNPLFIQQKKALFRTAVWIGAALLLLEAFKYLANIVYTYVLYFNNAQDSAQALPVQAVYSTWFSLLAFLPAFLLVARLSGHRVESLIPAKQFSVSSGLMAIAVCFTGFWAGNWLSALTNNLFGLFGLQPQQQSAAVPDNLPELLLYILYVAFVPALVEELTLRGVVMGMLRRFGTRFAVVASAVIFALMHGNFVQMPFAFCAGLGLGYAVVATGSLWPAIVAHLLNNAISCIAEYTKNQQGLSSWQYTTAVGTYSLLFWGLGILGIVLIVRRARKNPVMPRNDGLIPTTVKMSRLLVSPTLLIAGALYLLNAMSYLQPV